MRELSENGELLILLFSNTLFLLAEKAKRQNHCMIFSSGMAKRPSEESCWFINNLWAIPEAQGIQGVVHSGSALCPVIHNFGVKTAGVIHVVHSLTSWFSLLGQTLVPRVLLSQVETRDPPQQYSLGCENILRGIHMSLYHTPSPWSFSPNVNIKSCFHPQWKLTPWKLLSSSWFSAHEIIAFAWFSF